MRYWSHPSYFCWHHVIWLCPKIECQLSFVVCCVLILQGSYLFDYLQVWKIIIPPHLLLAGSTVLLPLLSSLLHPKFGQVLLHWNWVENCNHFTHFLHSSHRFGDHSYHCWHFCHFCRSADFFLFRPFIDWGHPFDHFELDSFPSIYSVLIHRVCFPCSL